MNFSIWECLKVSERAIYAGVRVSLGYYSGTKPTRSIEFHELFSNSPLNHNITVGVLQNLPKMNGYSKVIGGTGTFVFLVFAWILNMVLRRVEFLFVTVCVWKWYGSAVHFLFLYSISIAVPDKMDLRVCGNDSLQTGYCNDLPICGFCYDFGQSYTPSPEYTVYNTVSQFPFYASKNNRHFWQESKLSCRSCNLIFKTKSTWVVQESLVRIVLKHSNWQLVIKSVFS